MKASRVTPPTPCQWRGLFSALGCEQPLRNCECWIKKEIDDRYGDYATNHWKSLLTFLSDVVIAADSNCVSFQSVYHTLPVDQQRNLLAILYQRRSQIDQTALTQFIDTVKVECTDAGHPWLNLLWKLLSQHVGIIENGDHDDKGNPDNRHHQDLKQTDGKEAPNPDNEVNVNSALTVHQDVISVDTESQNDASNQTGRHGVNKDILDDCIIILDDDDEDDDDDEVDGLLPAAKRIKVEMKTANTDDNPDEDELLAQELMDQGVRLRELLHSSPEDSKTIETELKTLLQLPSDKISAVCKCCHLHSLPESRLAVLCDVLAKMTDVIGYTTCSVIVSGLLTTKLRELDQTASRVLHGVVTQLVKKFPRQTMDAIITRPVVENLGAAQSDILCCLCKESLSQPNLAYLLRKLVDETDILSEPALTVIHTILDATPDLDPETVSAILDCLSRSVCLHRSNLKFGKLLLSLVNKYAKQWNRLQLSTMNQISGNHKTFLSKKVITALKKNMK